ncbi:MAG: menaquinone biosynthesis protein [Planctomycetota bacterium]
MEPKRALRVGGVNYLNSQPLVHRFADLATERGLNARLVRDLPSRLADSLMTGRLDAALAPAFEALRSPSHRPISDACVAADGPVSSVKVYFRRPPADVRTLALDEGSRTSVALGRLLLIRRHGVRPNDVPLPIGDGLVDSTADAVLVIGDRAMTPPPAAVARSFVAEWDLAEEWRRDTGLPFVFAVWTAPRGVDCRDLVELLQACRDDGAGRLGEIAASHGPPLGLSVEHAHRYLRDRLRFRLGPREARGLAEFRRACRDEGLLPTPATALPSPGHATPPAATPAR